MKKDKNQIVSDKLDGMWGDLTEKARAVIAETEIGLYDELFGDLATAEEVNQFVAMNYGSEGADE